MKIIPIADENRDQRRTLLAFRPPLSWPAAEVKIIIVTQENSQLGMHSHPYEETFCLIGGRFKISTRQVGGETKETQILAPAMVLIEANEEHAFTCSVGSIMIGSMPVAYRAEDRHPSSQL